MTLATLSDICFELNIKPSIKIIPEEQRLTEEAKQILLEEKITEMSSWHKTECQLSKLNIGASSNNVIPIESHIGFNRAA